MLRTFFRLMIAPTIFWLTASVLLAFSLPGNLIAIAVIYAVLLPTLLLTWWVIAFARWLRRKFGWETLAYLLSNLALGFTQVGIGGAIAAAVAQRNNMLATLIFLFGCVVGTGWSLASIWRRMREGRHKQYNSIFWRALASTAWIWRLWEAAPVVDRSPVAPVAKGDTLSPISSKPTGNPLFRRVPLPPEPAPSSSVAVPIPPRTQPAPAPTPQSPTPPRTTHRTRNLATPAVSITIISDAQQNSFVAQASQLVARTETQAEPVPFSQYWPTYAHMSPEQQRWYFYWRTAVRAGQFLPTDLSYLFVYVYECINLVGFDTPQAAFDRLVAFWQHYRVLQPKLDAYLIDWLADFLVIHRLPMRPLAWYGQTVTGQQVNSGDPDLLIEGWLYTGGDCTLLPGPLLYRLADYAPEHSKFYQAYHRQHKLDAAYQKGVYAVDAYVRQSAGIPLFISYMPPTVRTIQRPPFAGALHAYGQTSLTIGQVRPWQAQEPLTIRLKSILKQTENVLREQLQFKSKLRGIDLPPDWVTAIQQAMVTPVAKRTVDIDFASVTLLQRDSAEIRQRLTVADDAGLATTNKTQAEPAQAFQSQNGAGAVDMVSSGRAVPDPWVTAPAPVAPTDKHPFAYTERPADAPAGMLTELTGIAAIMGDYASAEAQLLAALRTQNWQASPAILNTAQQHGFLNVRFDQINERALEHLGDALIFAEGGLWVVAEDYRDEIAYILDHPAYGMTGVTDAMDAPTTDAAPPIAPTPNHESVPQNTAIVDLVLPNKKLELPLELPVEWVELGCHFQEHHWATVTALLRGTDVKAQTDEIARRVYSTANQLIDEINEYALEWIDDLLIITQGETPMLADEHLESLQQLYTGRSG